MTSYITTSRLYVKKEKLENLKHYKYGCVDRSIMGKLVLNPLYGFLVEYIPIWMAPNLLTVLALAFTLAGYLAVCLHAPNLSGEAPRWTYAFSGVMVLMYQTFDGLDGKQARRTKTSSPLGELMDHGCDAINTVFLALTIGTTIQITPTPLVFYTATVLFFGFFLATWEEYHTGSLVHSEFAVPNEGLVLPSLFPAPTPS